MASKFKQDMPPAGGYGPIDWAKKVPKRGWGGYKSFAILGGIMAVGWSMTLWEVRHKRKYQVEKYDAIIALQPLILAERHRMFLRQLRQNREEEGELMKNVEGWEVGKWKGEPVYWNQADRFPEVNQHEYYAHSRWGEMYGRITERTNH